jgi:signal transduction histidine kinase
LRHSLPRFARTSSFRLTVGYALLLGLSSLILFGVVYWVATSYVAGEIDASVATEIAEEQADTGNRGLDGLRDIVAAQAARARPGAYYLLQDRSGRVLAGNLPPMRPILGIRELTLPSGVSVRGRGVAAPDGAFVFVALGDADLQELRDAVAYAFLWVVAGALVLALVSGALMSFGVLARVEAISQASRMIVAGDLEQRIALRGTDDEFDHLAGSLNAMLDRIQTLMEGLRQVTIDIAHDLRTPLSRHRQRMELALMEARSADELRTALEGSVGEVDAILQTFGALLTLARLESGADPPGFTELNLAEVLRNVTEAYGAVAEDQGQSLALRLTGVALPVSGSRELLTQLFANLIENALRHTPEGTAVDVSAETDGRAINVRVSDNGPGIPAALRQNVFRPFFRLDVSRTTPGTGLGLSLANAIAAMHHARISLADTHPGLTVEVSFGLEERFAEEANPPRWLRIAESASRWLLPPVLANSIVRIIRAPGVR